MQRYSVSLIKTIIETAFYEYYCDKWQSFATEKEKNG